MNMKFWLHARVRGFYYNMYRTKNLKKENLAFYENVFNTFANIALHVAF